MNLSTQKPKVAGDPHDSGRIQRRFLESYASISILNAYIGWLEPYWWRWVGVLTFREGIRARSGRTRLMTWLNCIRNGEHHPISYFAVRELGGESDHLHYHILLAGIGSRLRLYLPKWEEMAGYPKLGVFRSSFIRHTPEGLKQSSGIAYALKTLVHQDYEYEVDLHDEHLLPRYRR
jgi:hypothetical protein